MTTERSRIAEFFGREARRLSAFVRRRLDDSADVEAEDLVQEVFSALLDRADPLAEVTDLPAYVYRSLRNRIIDRLRRRRPQISLDETVDGTEGLTLTDILPHPDGSAHDQMAERERLAAFQRALEELSPQERAVIEANEFEGIPFRELSERWGEPVGTLLSRKSRALRKMAKVLHEHANSN